MMRQWLLPLCLLRQRTRCFWREREQARDWVRLQSQEQEQEQKQKEEQEQEQEQEQAKYRRRFRCCCTPYFVPVF